MLDNIIGKVERRRANYPHIDDAELQRRKASVVELRGLLTTIKTNMAAKQFQAKIDSDRKEVRCCLQRACGVVLLCLPRF